MAENIKGSSNQGQRNPQSNANQSQKQGAGEKSVSNPGTSGNQPGDPNKNKMSPGIEQDRSRQGNQGNQGNLGGQGSQSQGVSNPNKMAQDKDRVRQEDVGTDEDRSTQRSQRPNLDRDDQK